MNKAVFGKTMENVRKHGDIKLVKAKKTRSYLVSNFSSENLLAIEMRKIKLKINKPVYLGLSILEITKTPMCEFWYD